MKDSIPKEISEAITNSLGGYVGWEVLSEADRARKSLSELLEVEDEFDRPEAYYIEAYHFVDMEKLIREVLKRKCALIIGAREDKIEGLTRLTIENKGFLFDVSVGDGRFFFGEFSMTDTHDLKI